jgi:hypothetical protein
VARELQDSPKPDTPAATELPDDPGPHAGRQPTLSEWLVLVYHVPAEPSRLRAAVWRRIKQLGAIYLQKSVAAFPASEAAEFAMRKLRSEIIAMTGAATLMSCQVLAGEDDITAALQAASDDEYEEILDKCAEFITGPEKEYSAKHFSYAELEENEVDLVKLKKWLHRIRRRDIFRTDSQQKALDAVAECENNLEAYATRVYARETASH